MNRRHFYRMALGAAGVSTVGAGGWWAWDQLQRMGLDVGCRSDNLSTVSKHLGEYAERHNGILPPAAEILSVAQGEHESYLWCNQMELPYQWNLRLAGSALGSPGVRAIAWCPLGGHGRYVGAIIIRNGELHVEAITVVALREILGGPK
jgi:hypothetical protein